MALKEVPFDRKTGALIRSSHDLGGDVVLEPNEPFDGTLILYSFSRGRSSAVFLFRHLERNRQVRMFMVDMLATLGAFPVEPAREGARDAFAEMVAGTFHDREEAVATVTGRWAFVKRGANYGITPKPGNLVQ